MTNLKELEDEELIELENSLKKYLHHHKMYIRVLSVKMVKQGCTRIEVGNFLNVNRQTVGRWVKQYDKNGIEGLEPDYSNCGAECRLTNEQLGEIYEIITNPKEHYDIKRTRKLIKDKYNIEYSYKQVWVIVRKKLNLNYRKPYIKFNESPENADEDLKKNFKNKP